MLLPTTLPTATAPWPRKAAMADTASSGSDVPTATTVRPITDSGTPNLPATTIDASTSRRAPSTTPTRAARATSSGRMAPAGRGDSSSVSSSWRRASLSGLRRSDQ